MKPIFSLLLLAGAVAAQPAPKPPPGKPEPDYEAQLNDKLAKGITPATNANVLLWKALGPKPEGGDVSPEFFKRLGIDPPPEKGAYFVRSSEFMREHLKLGPGESEPFLDEYSRATQRPWKANDLPRIAAWLKLNEKPLAVVAEAVKRPDYYNPLIGSRTKNVRGMLLGEQMASGQMHRQLGLALASRAMLRIGEGKFDEAWQDLLACHRLARLVGRGGTLIEGLVGLAVEHTVSMAELAYLDRASLTAAQARERLKELQALPPLSPMADKIDLGERYIFLDSLQFIRRSGDKFLGDDLTPEELKGLEMLDWEMIANDGKKWYDRMAAAMRLGDRAGRVMEFDRIDADLKAQTKRVAEQTELIKKLLRGKDPGKEVSRQIGVVFIDLMMPAARRMQDSHDRAEQGRRNLFVAFALAAYRVDHDQFPAKLDGLAPKYLPAVPGDLFSGKPLIYRPEANGYLLYSIGENGKDDGGRWHGDDPPGGDDPRVRMPMPPPKPRK